MSERKGKFDYLKAAPGSEGSEVPFRFGVLTVKSTSVELEKIAKLLRACADDERLPNPLRYRNAAAFLESLAASGMEVPGARTTRRGNPGG